MLIKIDKHLHAFWIQRLFVTVRFNILQSDVVPLEKKRKKVANGKLSLLRGNLVFPLLFGVKMPIINAFNKLHAVQIFYCLHMWGYQWTQHNIPNVEKLGENYGFSEQFIISGYENWSFKSRSLGSLHINFRSWQVYWKAINGRKVRALLSFYINLFILEWSILGKGIPF